MSVATTNQIEESTFDKPWRDADLLYDLYWNQDMTQRQIADELDCSPSNISRWMNRLDVSSREHITVSHHIEERDGDLCYEKWNNNETSVLVHRLLAVAEYGFEEVCDKVVHHANTFKFDNRPENLELMSRSKHTSMHNSID